MIGEVQQRDYYRMLGLHPEASQKEIDRAYERLIHRFDSPALQKASFPPAALKEKIALLQEAYDTLSNPEKREAHDRALNLGRKRTDPDEESYSLPSLAELKEQNRKQKRNHNVYQDYYGFTEKPFDLTPDPKYLYLSPKHKEVLAHLVYGLQENNGFLKIVGEVGTGKTTICRSFLKELHADFNIAYIFNPGIDELELLQTINTELGLPSDSPSKKKLTDILNTFLLKEREQGHRVVVIIDEAQDLLPEVLEQLRLLSNLETETEKLIQIVLIGQPELDDLLHRDDLRQLRQRITIQWELLPLNLEETRGYIQHRLNVALGKGKVRFTRAAMECIYRYSHGIPRTINVVADRALLIAFTQSTKKITTRVVRRAVKDIGGLRPLTSWRGTVWKKILPAFAGVALLAYGVDRWVLPDWKPPPDPGPDIHSLIEKNPIDLKQPGELVPQKTPQAAATPAPEKPVPTQPAARDRAEEPDRKRRIGPSQALVLSQTDKLITYLSSLSFMESKIEAYQWIIERWGFQADALRDDGPFILSDLEGEYGLLEYELSGNFRRLTTLNYPAVLELSLPDAQGTKYLALMTVKGDRGVFGSVDPIEMPLSTIDPIWTRKAIVLWKDFEHLPPMERGFRGREALWLQKNLRLLGFFKGPEAPLYGAQTENAVLQFQRQNSLKDDGKFHTESRILLYNLLNIYPTPKLVEP